MDRYAPENLLYFDFESRSPVPIDRGSYRYAVEADAVLLAYAIGLGPLQLVDRRGAALRYGDLPDDLRQAYESGKVFCAWNTNFDRCIWNYALDNSPFLAPGQVIDARAAALAHNLPDNLETASTRLGGSGKRKDGKSLIARFCSAKAVMADDDPEAWERFCLYAKQDVEELRRVFRLILPALTDYDWSAYQANEVVNDTGAGVDLRFCQHAARLAFEDTARTNARLTVLTNGAITSIHQHLRIAQFVHDRLPSAEARLKMSIVYKEEAEGEDDEDLVEKVKLTISRGVVERLLDMLRATGCDDKILMEVLELREFGASAAPKKFQAILNSHIDGRIYGGFVFNGGGQTGRFSGRGVQCVTGDHEALTRHGWRRLDEIVGPCEIMAWSRDGTMRWEAGEVNAFGVPEQVAHINGTMIRGTYTLDHRMPTRHTESSAPVDYTPQMLMGVQKRGGFMIAGTVDQPDAPFNDAQLRLLVAMQADGHWAKRAAHWRFTKIRKIERLDMLLDEAGVPFHRKVEKDGVTLFRINTGNVPSWLVKDFGSWTLSLSARQAALVLEEIRQWDGYSHTRGHLQVASPRKDQMEWVATIAALAGRSATLAWYPTNKSKRGRWVVYIRSSVTTTLHRAEVEITQGINPVFCPTVPSGYWLCRVSDRIFVTGNTQNLTRTVLGKDAYDDYGYWEDATVALISDGCTLDELAAHGNGEVPARKLALTIRPAFIAKGTRTLIKADYSQIEARVLPWLSQSKGGDELLDSFRRADADPSEPDLYRVTAAKMTGKKPEEISREERQRGKVAVLACVSEGERILTDVGLVRIEDVTCAMRVWDGVAFVAHDGVVFRGVKDVWEYQGLTATADHIVWTKEAGPVRLDDAAGSGHHLVQTGAGRTAIRLGDDHFAGASLHAAELSRTLCAGPLQWLPERVLDILEQFTTGIITWLPSLHTTAASAVVAGPPLDRSKTALCQFERSGMEKLRRAWHRISVPNGDGSRSVGNETLRSAPRSGDRSCGQRRTLCSRQFAVHDTPRQYSQQTEQYATARLGVPTGAVALRAEHGAKEIVGRPHPRGDHQTSPAGSTGETQGLAHYRGKTRVYDILNAGPRHRFTVSNVLVHNCGFGGGRNALHAMAASYRLHFTDAQAQEIVDTWRLANPWAPTFWGRYVKDGSYGLFGAARQAIERPYAPIDAGRVKFVYVPIRRDGTLLCILPSGRPLVYPSCRMRDYDIVDKTTKRVLDTRHGLTFRRARGIIALYGGRFAENITQATAADLLREAIVRLVNEKFEVVSHSHDEIVVECERRDIERTMAAMKEAMVFDRPWAAGLPLTVDMTERWFYSAKKDAA